MCAKCNQPDAAAAAQPGDKLLLWYLACYGMPPATLLSELNLDVGELEQLKRDHATEFDDLRKQAALVALLDRKALGRLLLSNYLGHLVLAPGGRQAATLLRVAKQLPQWVLPANLAAELGAGDDSSFANELALVRTRLAEARRDQAGPRNRAERRALAAEGY